MLRAVSITSVEIDLHANAITHRRPGHLSNITVQVKIKTSVAYRHHVDAACLFGLAIDAHQDRKRLAPAWLNGTRMGSTDKNERVDTSNVDGRAETRCHVNLEPVSVGEMESSSWLLESWPTTPLMGKAIMSSTRIPSISQACRDRITKEDT
jgi:hypothetical protein